MRRFLTPLLVACLLFAAAAQAQDALPLSRIDKANQQQARMDLRKLQEDLNAYFAATKAYPDKLDKLVEAGLREKVPKDPWSHDYAYRAKDGDFELTCLGSDGKAGGTGGEVDIVFTSAGEKRELTATEKADLAKKRDEQAFNGMKCLALARMRYLGTLLIQHYRSNQKWPAALADLKAKGTAAADLARNKCFNDPWGHEFTFKALPNENFAVACHGVDGKEGGSGRDGDFVVTERDVRVDTIPRPRYGGSDDDRDRGRVDDLAEGVKQFQKEKKRLPRDLDELVTSKVRMSIAKGKYGNEYIYFTLGADEFYVVYLGRDDMPGGISESADAIAPQPGASTDREGTSVKEMDVDMMIKTATEKLLGSMVENLKSYKEKNEKYPETLEDAKEFFPGGAVPMSMWGGQIEYELVKDDKDVVTGFHLVCRGKDGKAGGVGYDEDFGVDQDGKSIVIAAEKKDD